MTDDATLSDFASAATDESNDDSSTKGDGDGDSTAEADADPTPEAGAEPASGVDSDTPSADAEDSTGEAGLSTYAWGEFDCGQCDGATDRVWRSDGDLVCPDCKEW
ncbi:hypothetical protein CP556_08915 [Natrinema sp. CBA1119]|uniref:DUF7573 domain-containing protein n=1 Tax=Natrinema sp. CBA1119 TaxID=1608465 RepID=UPI000BF71B6E|nr:hypothetical protein [Natrinema sp. CBA1119]PGF16221.1 hypothetical protein CP556_08915 [Natrinema sp. CBA1119]